MSSGHTSVYLSAAHLQDESACRRRSTIDPRGYYKRMTGVRKMTDEFSGMPVL